MHRRSFLQLLGASLIVVAAKPIPAASTVPAMARTSSDAAWLDLTNAYAFVVVGQIVAPYNRAYYLSKARLCLMRYKERVNAP